MQPAVNSEKTDELKVVAYAGDNKILLAMSLRDNAIDEHDKNLAGFAIWRTVNGKTDALENRITFNVGVSRATTAQTRKWAPSD
jgi:hypothetical protein